MPRSRRQPPPATPSHPLSQSSDTTLPTLNPEAPEQKHHTTSRKTAQYRANESAIPPGLRICFHPYSSTGVPLVGEYGQRPKHGAHWFANHLANRCARLDVNPVQTITKGPRVLDEDWIEVDWVRDHKFQAREVVPDYERMSGVLCSCSNYRTLWYESFGGSADLGMRRVEQATDQPSCRAGEEESA
jgi:hypothetical protein